MTGTHQNPEPTSNTLQNTVVTDGSNVGAIFGSGIEPLVKNVFATVDTVENSNDLFDDEFAADFKNVYIDGSSASDEFSTDLNSWEFQYDSATLDSQTYNNACRVVGLDLENTWGISQETGYPVLLEFNPDAETKTCDIKSEFNNLAGSGTSSDPYQISTVEELQAMNLDLEAHYELTSDIDASGTSSWNDGKGFYPIATNSSREFDGSFDGNGYTISGLTIDRPNQDNVGLFGVSRVGFSNIHLANADITGNNNVGGLVAVDRYPAITDITVTDSSISGSSIVGGVIGEGGDSIKRVGVRSTQVNGGSTVGGVAGETGYTTITDVYAIDVTVTGSNNMGGIMGDDSQSSLTNIVLSVSTVEGDSENLYGEEFATDFSNVYYNSDTTTTDHGTGLTTSEMQGSSASSNMSEFDWSTTWTTVSGDYPQLQE